MEIKFKKYWRKTSLKKKEDAYFLLNHIEKLRPKNFLEIGVFHGVTARNVCELLFKINGNNFKFTGIDLFLSDSEISKEEFIPKNIFSNPLKRFYYNHIIRLDPYSIKSVLNLLKKFKSNVTIIKGNSNIKIKEININEIDYVFLDGGHKYETVKSDLLNVHPVLKNNGTILCDDYNLSYAPGVRKAIDEFVNNNNLNLRIFNSRFAEITKK